MAPTLISSLNEQAIQVIHSLSSRATSAEKDFGAVVLNTTQREAIFYCLLIAQVAFLVMFGFVFGFRNKHCKDWIFLNFCFTWVLYAVSFCLLFYTGQVEGDQPNYGLCVLQSFLVYVTPVLTSASMLTLAYHLWASIQFGLGRGTKATNLRLSILLLAPYIVAMIPAVSGAMIAGMDPTKVRRSPDTFHCSVDFHPQRIITAVLTSTSLLMTIIFQALVARDLFHNRLALKQVNVQGWDIVQLFIRMSLFILLSTSGVAMTIVVMIDPTNLARTIFQGVLPLPAFILFGTRPSFYKPSKEENKAPKAPVPEMGNTRAGFVTLP